jgi:hypothetical protein
MAFAQKNPALAASSVSPNPITQFNAPPGFLPLTTEILTAKMAATLLTTEVSTKKTG